MGQTLLRRPARHERRRPARAGHRIPRLPRPRRRLDERRRMAAQTPHHPLARADERAVPARLAGRAQTLPPATLRRAGQPRPAHRRRHRPACQPKPGARALLHRKKRHPRHLPHHPLEALRRTDPQPRWLPTHHPRLPRLDSACLLGAHHLAGASRRRQTAGA